RLPLRDTRAIFLLTTTGGSVAAQLTRDPPGVALQNASDLAHPGTRGPKDRDLLPLFEHQVAARGFIQRDRRHAASMAKPPGAHWNRHADLDRGLSRGDPR